MSERLWCARCGKIVDMIRQWHEIDRDVWVYEAHCHGEVERAELTAMDVIEALKVDFARAFEQRTLERKQ